LEKHIDKMESLLSAVPQGKLFVTENDLPDNAKAAILKRLQTLKQCLYEYADLLNLEPAHDSLFKILRGTLSLDAEDVSKLETDRLSGYGDNPNKETAQMLDTYSVKLQQLIREVLW
jgi:hypothetical protein